MQLHQPAQDQVAHRVAGQRVTAGEAVLEQPRAVLVPGQRGQRLTQVTRREYPPLRAQPAAGPAVVGDRDHRGDLQIRYPAQRA